MLKYKLIAAGAPAGFTFHQVRHTVATWLQNEGWSEWERGLVLNHAESGVTGGYSHGVAIDPKRMMLTAWAEHVVNVGQLTGHLSTVFGWTLRTENTLRSTTLRNFPMQANGAEMLRLACCSLTEAGARVCAPVHDALLVEAPAGDIEGAVAACQRSMGRASEAVLKGFRLRTEAKVVRHPDRLLDDRGRPMWELVLGLLDRGVATRCA